MLSSKKWPIQITRQQVSSTTYKVKQTVDDLVLDEGGQFLDLPVNLTLRLSTILKDFLQKPYDYFCPTVKLRLSSRTCKTCGLYHASVKSLNRHIEKIHKKVNTPTEGKVRPVRVAARRANETDVHYSKFRAPRC
nr:unnamed protein product [Callosobruchus chinensis]